MGGGRRPAFIWTYETPAADLLGTVSLWPDICCCMQRAVASLADATVLEGCKRLLTFLQVCSNVFNPQVSAALASASLLTKPSFPEKADLYLRTARALYSWAAYRPGARLVQAGSRGCQGGLQAWVRAVLPSRPRCSAHRLPLCWIAVQLCLQSINARAGLFAKSYEGYPEWLYGTSYYNDKLMLAAGWLYRATGARSGWTARHLGCLQWKLC